MKLDARTLLQALAVACVLAASGGAAQTTGSGVACPPGTVLVWSYQAVDLTHLSSAPVATGTCLPDTRNGADIAQAAAAGESTPAAAPAATQEPPSCPAGTVAVTSYQDMDVTNPSAAPVVSIFCLPEKPHARPTAVPLVTATMDPLAPAPAPEPATAPVHGARSGTQPLVTATLEGVEDLTPVPQPPPALEPCGMGAVHAADKCTPW